MKGWMTLKETWLLLDLSPVWVRRMTKQGKLGEVRRDLAGRILIQEENVLAYREELEAKRARPIGERKSRVPSLQAVGIISRAVQNDPDLSEEQRKEFLNALERYQTFFTARLEAIRAERAR